MRATDRAAGCRGVLATTELRQILGFVQYHEHEAVSNLQTWAIPCAPLAARVTTVSTWSPVAKTRRSSSSASATATRPSATRAVLVTTAYFTPAAVAWANDKPIELWDGRHITRLGFAVPATPALTETVDPGSDITPEVLAPRHPRCGSELVEKHNRRTGEAFLGCSGYPACRYTQSLAPARRGDAGARLLHARVVGLAMQSTAYFEQPA